MFNYNVNKTMYDDKDTFDNLAKQYTADLEFYMIEIDFF